MCNLNNLVLSYLPTDLCDCWLAVHFILNQSLIYESPHGVACLQRNRPGSYRAGGAAAWHIKTPGVGQQYRIVHNFICVYLVEFNGNHSRLPPYPGSS